MRSTISQQTQSRLSWIHMGITALTLVFGMQVVRVLATSAFWVLRDRMHWHATEVAVLGLAVFATAFLAGPLSRLLGPRVTLIVTAGGLGAVRLAMQIWTGDPVGELSLAITGVILFVLFLATYLDRVRSEGPSATRSLALGLLLGLSLDVFLHGGFSTYDMGWHSGAGALTVVIVLAAAQWALLTPLLIRAKSFQQGGPAMEAGEGHWRIVLPWLAVGPFLLLELLVFQNLGRLTTLTGWAFPLAFAWMAFSHALGIAAALWILHRGPRPLWPFAVVGGSVLVAVLAMPGVDGLSGALLLLVGQVSAAVLIVVIIQGVTKASPGQGMTRTTVTHGLGMLLLVILLFGFYAVYDINLGFSNNLLPPLAGLILGISALAAVRSLRLERPSGRISWLQLQLAFVFLAVALVWSIAWDTPGTTAGDGYPVRIMTYNLHNGVDIQGHLGMEAQARVIEAQRPDVVALQEVSRGWVVNGSIDMLAWLSQRLDMPYVYGATAGPLWGNALLSRYPILESGAEELLPQDLLITRGFVWARLDVGDGQDIWVINTHYHHPEEDNAIRVEQTREVLGFLEGKDRAVFVGDLNTRLGEEPLEILRQAGLSDAMDMVGLKPGFTTPPANPQHRIDYIWVSSDLRVLDVEIPRTLASDHLPVVATIAQ